MHKAQYLELLLESGVLKFGSFQTKSGRQSPYFFNMGQINSGRLIERAANAYSELIAERFPETQNLYGPAYKGIPLAVATATALSKRLNRDISFTFNRKEAKDHGEGGQLVGHKYAGGEKVVIIEDVITGGTSFAETKPILSHAEAEVVGLVVGVDRQERGKGTLSAAREAGELYGCDFASIVNMDWLVSHLSENEVLGQRWISPEQLEAIAAYRSQYGA